MLCVYFPFIPVNAAVADYIFPEMAAAVFSIPHILLEP